MLPFARVAIIGMGLIGSSLARAIRAAMPTVHISVSDADGEVRARVTELGLADDVADSDVFEAIVNDNQLAGEHCLASAQPLLAQGHRPQAMAIFNRYSALQLYSPTQVSAGWNNVPQWAREQRQALKDQGIDLTVVVPQSLKTPVTSAQAVPDAWTPQSAAQELISRLALREPEWVLEVLDISTLWPLPR
jgi:threonine dehydrogenase-like Zn-dependent dehydrogenase